MLSADVYFTTVAHYLLKLLGDENVNFLFGHHVGENSTESVTKTSKHLEPNQK